MKERTFLKCLKSHAKVWTKSLFSSRTGKISGASISVCIHGSLSFQIVDNLSPPFAAFYCICLSLAETEKSEKTRASCF